MRKDFEQLFAKISQPEPRPGLFFDTMQLIEKAEKRAVLIKLWLFSGTFVSSLVVIVMAVIWTQHGFEETGFWQYFSMIFSDLDIIAIYWKSFLLSLIESLPALALMVGFSAFWLVAHSARLLLKNFVIFKKISQFNNA